MIVGSMNTEIVFLILQYLTERGFKETLHKLEQESGVFFNMKHFKEQALAGEWDEVEKYLSGFINMNDYYSMKIIFEIKKQKYFEALDRNDKVKAADILVNDLKGFSKCNEDFYREIARLIILEDFREKEQLSKYDDTKSARNTKILELKKLIEAYPLFSDKLKFPSVEASRLHTLLNQGLNWQHHLCKYPKPKPDIKSLFTNHICIPPNAAHAPTPVSFPVTATAMPSSDAPIGLFPPSPRAANDKALAGWMVNASPSSSIKSPAFAASSFPGPPNQVYTLRHSRTPSITLGMMDDQNTDHQQLMKRLKPVHSANEVTFPAPPQQASRSLDDLPRTVVCMLHQGSTVTSMDFHPSVHTLLAVGCGNGEISLWETGLRERLISTPFKIKDIAACSVFFQAAIMKDSSVSVSCISWSPDGKFIGVAFMKHLVHLYAYQGPNDLRQNLEIDAHVGRVNDLAFSYPNEQLCIVTCGDDKSIKVWDLAGRKLFNFEGHEAPVYSVCPHKMENTQFIFSNAVDGKIKVWMYDNLGSRVNYNATSNWCATMRYSTDGSRLFSCGTIEDGVSFLVEWNVSDGALKRKYAGFRKKSAGVVQFDTAKNRYLAVGEDNKIKFWYMDNIKVLTSTDAEGGLPSLPRLKFNKEGNLLAVTTVDGGLKILANTDGMKYLKSIEAGLRILADANCMKYLKAIEARSYEVSKAPVDTKNGIDCMARSIEKQSLDDLADKSKTWESTIIVDPVHCRTVTIPDSADPTNKVVCLLYTNSGAGLLALGVKGVQKLWKWSRNEQNPAGKATPSVPPQHWQPDSGLLMTNDVTDNLEEVFPCMALSKKDSFVMSVCGGKISVFNMMTFKVMITLTSPPPSSTFLAFHPQDNNIIAVGMEDATIHFYDARVDEVKYKLTGHQKRITGLAFSTHLNILVSSSADGQLCCWSIDSLDKKQSLSIQLPAGKAPDGDTSVHFHYNQVHLLVCHESQLAIYDASNMELIRQWVPQDGLTGSISSATYSCDSQLIYAAFTDGNIGVFDADRLRLRCRITSSAYLHQTSSNSQNIYPLVVAAHPLETLRWLC